MTTDTADRMQLLGEHAAVLDAAALGRRETEMLTATHTELSIADAYLVQDRLVARRIERGERVIGRKMGLTSRAKMEQVGVSEPIYGVLTDAMLLEDGATLELSTLIHPKAEPEIAFVLGRELRGPVAAAHAFEAVSGVCAAIEVIDSRYRDFKFTLPDVIADNTSASRFVLGSDVVSPAGLNLGNLGILFEVNGRIVETASSAAVLDHPVRSLVALVNLLSRRGLSLEAGSIVLTGGATTAVSLQPGQRVRAIVEGVGTADLRVGI